MQLPIVKLLGFDNQLLKMSCQTVNYNFPHTVLGDLLDLELKQKWAPKHSLLCQKTGKKIPNGKPGPEDSTFYGIFCRQSIST